MTEDILDIHLCLNSGEVNVILRDVSRNGNPENGPKFYYEDSSWWLYVGSLEVPFGTKSMDYLLKEKVERMVEDEAESFSQALAYRYSRWTTYIKDEIKGVE